MNYEERVELLDKELEAAREKVLETEALKRAFVASVRHEIRTPLAGILGMNELLLLTDLDENQRHLARIVQESSEALLHVVNDFLDLSRLEKGAPVLTSVPFNLALLVEESVKLVGASIAYKGLEMRTSIDTLPPVLYGDPERIRQVLLNLLSNAVKFTAQGTVSLTVKLLHENSSSCLVQFTISDTGIGIEQDQQPLLFVPFWQGDMKDTRRYGGVGLGLPLSKFFVEQMGGNGIHVESERSRGSTFWFELPLPKIDSQANSRPTAEPDILVVEDNPMLNSAVLNQLQGFGIGAAGATTYGDALALIAAHRYSLVICERTTAESNTENFVARIRELDKEKTQRTAIIVLSPSDDERERQALIRAGADEYLKKPISSKTLWTIIKLYCQD